MKETQGPYPQEASDDEAGLGYQNTLEPAEAAKARMRAINIDRFSRVFFPLLFSVLNATYWFQFAQYI